MLVMKARGTSVGLAVQAPLINVSFDIVNGKLNHPNMNELKQVKNR
jgi:hypothetical protein